MSQTLSSAAVVIGTLRVNKPLSAKDTHTYSSKKSIFNIFHINIQCNEYRRKNSQMNQA